MKKFRFVLVFLLISFLGFAQEKDSLKNAKIIKDKTDGLSVNLYHQYSMDDKIPRIIYHNINKPESPVLFLNGHETSFQVVKTLDPNVIESISILKGNESHGIKDTDQILVTTKSDRKVKLISMIDLIKKYSLPKNEQMLISINDEIVNENLEKLYVDESQVMQINVICLDKIAKNTTWVHLKILTRNPENIREVNEILIR